MRVFVSTRPDIGQYFAPSRRHRPLAYSNTFGRTVTTAVGENSDGMTRPDSRMSAFTGRALIGTLMRHLFRRA